MASPCSEGVELFDSQDGIPERWKLTIFQPDSRFATTFDDLESVIFRCREYGRGHENKGKTQDLEIAHAAPRV
jgi:hypothetical protein